MTGIRKGNDSMSPTSQSQSNRSQKKQNAGNEHAVAPSLLSSLEWRSIGPYRGGRVVAVAGDPSHSHTFYFGSTGDGVYKSTDAGKTWTHLGLEDTRNIGKVRIYPTDHNIVYVAALGHAHGPN